MKDVFAIRVSWFHIHTLHTGRWFSVLNYDAITPIAKLLETSVQARERRARSPRRPSSSSSGSGYPACASCSTWHCAGTVSVNRSVKYRSPRLFLLAFTHYRTLAIIKARRAQQSVSTCLGRTGNLEHRSWVHCRPRYSTARRLLIAYSYCLIIICLSSVSTRDDLARNALLLFAC